MRLLLLRHGEAGYDTLRDSDRSLTANGRLRLQNTLQKHSDLLLGVCRIVHSPYVRTCQTADIVQKFCPVGLQEQALLTPESSPQQVLDWLAGQQDEALLLVTHQPLVGKLVSLLCEGDLSRPEPMLPGALAVIETDFPAAGLGRLTQLI